MSRRIRVGLVAYEYPPLCGGMATYARALAEFLTDRGYELHIFANTQAADISPGVVHPLLTTDLARDMPRLAKFDMDLWHAINFGYAPLATIKRPFVLTVHGNDFLNPWIRCSMDRVPGLWRASGLMNRRAVRRAIYPLALRCVDAVLTCSRFSARRFRREFPSSVRPQVVPNGVAAYFLEGSGTAVDGSSGDPQQQGRIPRVLTVCNLDMANRRKNVDGCLQAVAEVLKHHELEYGIIGEGPLRPVLEAHARALKIDHRVRFMGRVDAQQLRQAYADADLFLLAPRPSPRDVEGFGIVYLEAAALGTPSLATRCGGVAEAVRDGVSGFFADHPTPEAIAAALRQFVTRRIQFDRRQVTQYAALHTWPRVLRRVDRLYQRLLAGRGLARHRTMCTLTSAEVHNFAVAQLQTSREAADGYTGQIRSDLIGLPDGDGCSTAVESNRQSLPAVCRLDRPKDDNLGVQQRTAKSVDPESPRQTSWEGWLRNAPAVAASGGGGGGRALLFSYTFPPVGGSGVQRPSKLVKHLHECGWQVEVITAGHQRFPWHDPSLTRDLPVETAVHRVQGWEPACVAASISAGLRTVTRAPLTGINWLEDRIYWRLAAKTSWMNRGDGHDLWLGSAVRAAQRQHAMRAFDLVISTGPPTFVHQVGLRAARNLGLPWVADVRDPLISDFDRAGGDREGSARLRRLERQIMTHAALVVTTCRSLAEDFLARYPHRSPESVQSLTNGFDRHDLLAALDGCSHAKPAGQSDICTLIAPGSFYGRRELARLVEPIERVLADRPAWRDPVRLVVAGTLDARQKNYWEQHSPPWLTLTGYLDHAAVIQRIAAAHCAVVMVPDCRHTRLCIPGKLFELLALPTHLLALMPPGSETEQIVRRAGAATIAPLEDCAAVAAAVERVIAEHQAGRLQSQRDWTALDVFDRRVLARRFANCLDRVRTIEKGNRR